MRHDASTLGCPGVEPRHISCAQSRQYRYAICPAGVLLRAGRRADARREYDWLRAIVPTFEGMDELAKHLAEPERPWCRTMPHEVSPGSTIW